MDHDRALFIFGSIPEGWDIDDAEERQSLLTADDEPAGKLPALMRATVLEQVAIDRPAAVWATAQRLLAAGQHREQIIAGLVMAFTAAVEQSCEDNEGGFDESRYVALLDTLPLPTEGEIEAAITGALRAPSAPADAEELAAAAIALLSRPDDRLLRSVVGYTIEELIEDDAVTVLPSERPVLVAEMTAGMTLTHRLTDAERAHGVLDVTFDLAPFAEDMVDGRWTPDGEPLDPVPWGPEGEGWQGPPGWLDGWPAGALLAVRLVDDGVVVVEPAGEADNAGLVPRAVTAVEECWAAAGLPLDAAGLAFMLAADDPTAFSVPRPPLSELCQAAGLELRGGSVAGNDAAWAAQEDALLDARLADRFDEPEDRDDVRHVLALATDPPSWNDPGAFEVAIGVAAEDDLVRAVADELAPPDGPVPTPESQAFVAALTTAAGRAGDADTVAGARWLTAVLAERAGDLAAADAHLAVALEVQPQHELTLRRAAWYASDRGDAAGALRHLRRLDEPDPDDIRILERYARPPGAKVGRNDPCWCGSGRKHKHCHLDQPAPWPLPDRVEWLCHKVVSFIEHRGGGAGRCLTEHALAWLEGAGPAEEAASDEERARWLFQAFTDPLVADTTLVEGGYHEAFLAERAPLLPDDEVMLFRAWTLVPRTVYEIESVTPTGLTVRDLRSGERLAVRERRHSRVAQAGEFVCGRAVPDGDTHQFVGGLLPVDPGTQSSVLELCDREDGPGLCQWAGGRHRRPRIVTREHEPVLTCRAEVEVPDPRAAAAVLDRCYDRQAPGWWHEMHDIDEDEQILRAQISLEGNRLVITTNAEARVERVLEVIRSGIDGARVVVDVREPLAPGEMPSVRTPPGGWEEPGHGDRAVNVLTMTSLQEAMEKRWLDEPVPALGGLTPWEAADDPTRRDELVRLLATFPDPEPDSPLLMPRPDRLRQQLGLPPRAVKD